jgi:hypothetical protein
VRPRSVFPFVVATFALALPPRGARGDVTSWLAIGGGYGVQRDRVAKHNQFATTLTYSLGVGSSPLSPLVLGGLVRGTSFLGLGTDLGVAVRAATGGFARGEWGAAIEAGGLWRPWLNGVYGEWPVQAVLTGGSPWGLELAVGAEFASLSGARAAVGAFAALEIDLLRLTVMRQGATEKWWYNPAPAGGHQ